MADPEIEKNIAAGKADMTKALADNATNQTAAVAQLAQKLSDKSDMTDAQKGAQFQGYLQAIEDSSVPQAQKQALQREVIRNVDGTAAADSDAKNKQSEAADVSSTPVADTTEPVTVDVDTTAAASAEPDVTVDGEAQD